MTPQRKQNRLMDMARYAKRLVEAGELDWRERYRYYLAIANDDLVQSLLQQTFARDEDGFFKAASKDLSADPLSRLFQIDWQTQLSENLLLLTDKMSMAVSLECRVPFLDQGLVELASRIPARHKLPGGRLKGLLKDALQDVLPPDILHRRKRGFGAPVGAWFKNELLPLRKELLGRRTVVGSRAASAESRESGRRR